MARKIILLFVLAFSLFTIYIIHKNSQFDKNYAYAIGTIWKISGPGYRQGGNYAVLYKWEVDGKTYTNGVNYSFCGDLSFEKVKQLLIGIKIPIVYSAKDPKWGSEILLRKFDSDRFGYNYPDSLLRYDSILTCK